VNSRRGLALFRVPRAELGLIFGLIQSLNG
jgi:hypothetical protein